MQSVYPDKPVGSKMLGTKVRDHHEIIAIKDGRLVDHFQKSYLANGMDQAEAMAHGANQGYWILLPAYIIIFLYAFKGHKIKSWS